jgi:hypothetical protein
MSRQRRFNLTVDLDAVEDVRRIERMQDELEQSARRANEDDVMFYMMPMLESNTVTEVDPRFLYNTQRVITAFLKKHTVTSLVQARRRRELIQIYITVLETAMTELMLRVLGEYEEDGEENDKQKWPISMLTTTLVYAYHKMLCYETDNVEAVTQRVRDFYTTNVIHPLLDSDMVELSNRGRYALQRVVEKNMRRQRQQLRRT